MLLEVSDRIATVTLNRPAARNALSSEVLRLLPALLREADGRDDVDVVILTGADPAFCAGLDLKELGSSGGNLRAGNADGSDSAARSARSVPADGEAGDRRGQRRRDHRRLRARAQLRLPRRLRTSPLRRHAHARRRDARLGAHRALAASDRRATGEGDELHRQLPRRARGVPVGPRQPCRAARRAAPVLPWPRHRPDRQRPARRAPDPQDLRRGHVGHRRRRMGCRAPRLTRLAARPRGSIRRRSSAAAWRSSSAAAPRPEPAASR